MSFKRFIIPDGDPVEQIQLLSDELRNAWDEAGQRRFRFMQYKRALRKFHLRSTDSDETRAILRMVSSNHRFHKQIFCSESDCDEGEVSLLSTKWRTARQETINVAIGGCNSECETTFSS